MLRFLSMMVSGGVNDKFSKGNLNPQKSESWNSFIDARWLCVSKYVNCFNIQYIWASLQAHVSWQLEALMCAEMQQFHWHPHNNALWHFYTVDMQLGKLTASRLILSPWWKMHTDLSANRKLQLGMREINVFTPKVTYSLQRQYYFVFVSEFLTLCSFRLCMQYTVCVCVSFICIVSTWRPLVVRVRGFST